MLLGGYIKLARASMRSSRWRSLLTMLGIIIGIVSVVTTVSIGEGVKQQIVNQISQRGEDLITVLPGRPLERTGASYLNSFNPVSSQTAIVFGDADYRLVASVPGASVAPFGHVAGEVKTRESSYDKAQVIATSADLPDVLNQELEFGSFFSDSDTSSANGAIIGRTVAEQLFGQNVPLGQDFTIRDTRFIVRGIFEEFSDTSPLLPMNNYDNAIFIPYTLGQELMGGNLQVYQMLVKPSVPEDTADVIASIEATLKKSRGNQQDFSVLRQSDNLSLAEDVLDLLTSLIAGVAAISLLVGGIGIMNIMLVSVTERTQEIGIRKAVGATNRQILYQFMTEAAVLSLAGGVFGILFSLLTNFLLRITTDLQPVITLDVILIASGVSFAVGIIFGVAPAAIAARKDPIESLRYE